MTFCLFFEKVQFMNCFWNESLSGIRQLANARLERVEYTINYFKEHDQIPETKKRGGLQNLHHKSLMKFQKWLQMAVQCLSSSKLQSLIYLI